MDFKAKLKIFWPAGIVLLIGCAYVLLRLSNYSWDPVGLAEVGTKYSEGDENGTEGYDGQFAYYIALNPNPDEVSVHLDVPAYRYQRILYPILARFFAGGNADLIPWTLILINLVAIVIGTAILAAYLVSEQTPSRYALIYGLWVGLLIGVGADLYEPLAYAFIVAAIYARFKQRKWLCLLLISCALLTKETLLPFWAAFVIADLVKEKFSRQSLIVLLPGVVYAIWQLWLFFQFGATGLTSGGAMATSFEWFPYGGFLRIGSAGIQVLLLFALIFVPTIILPNLWGTISSGGAIFRGDRGIISWVLFLNTLPITFLPFSTFREPIGLVRVATGLIVAILIFAASQSMRRPLNLGMFWLALLVMLVQ